MKLESNWRQNHFSMPIMDCLSALLSINSADKQSIIASLNYLSPNCLQMSVLLDRTDVPSNSHHNWFAY